MLHHDVQEVGHGNFRRVRTSIHHDYDAVSPVHICSGLKTLTVGLGEQVPELGFSIFLISIIEQIAKKVIVALSFILFQPISRDANIEVHPRLAMPPPAVKLRLPAIEGVPERRPCKCDRYFGAFVQRLDCMGLVDFPSLQALHLYQVGPSFEHA
jgi:hypothetical protein